MKHKFASKFFVLFVLLALIFSGWGTTLARAAGRCYVNDDTTRLNNGTSWLDAYLSLQTALADSCTEIWVASGVYMPIIGTNRAATFQLKSGVAIYGGFYGTETTLEERDPLTNYTILSGDIDYNDNQSPITNLATVTGNTTNSYHVVTGATGATLDGFTITAGNANGGYQEPCNQQCGGGMFNVNSNPTISNVTFIGNAAFYGGAMNNESSAPAISNSTFSGNMADNYGGGIYSYASSPMLTNVTFSGNLANLGGGMFNNWFSNPTLTNVTFSGNTATSSGGGMYNINSSSPTVTDTTFSGNSATDMGGGMSNEANSSPAVTNVTFSGNSAFVGGGMLNHSSSPTVTNATFSGNSASFEGGGMYNIGGSPTLKNVIIANSVSGGDCVNGVNATSANNLIESISANACGLSNGANGNITGSDPLLGALGNYGGATQTFSLLPGSPAINAGSNCPDTDQRGKFRGTVCDIGAFEYNYLKPLHVKPDGTGDCTGWTNACTLQTALSGADSGQEIWVATGTYKPTDVTDRNATFQLKDGVAVYGGFPNTGTPTLDDRNPATNLTILSGDISTVGTATDNSYHVVTGASNATLDGFTITGGYANGSATNSYGGGIYNNSISNATFSNLEISGNYASGTGGGVDNHLSTVTFTNVTVANNSTPSGSYGGGGMFNWNSNSIVTNATFVGNTSSYGGGMHNDWSSPTLTNVTFAGNTASSSGSGIFNQNSSNATIRNAIVWGNSGDSTQIVNVSSTPTVTYSVVQGGYSGTGNLSANPNLGELGYYGSSTLTIPLLPGSSAIDAGDDTTCAAAPVNKLDQRGVIRPQGAHCDIGAFEAEVYTLAITSTHGTVTKNPDLPTYHEGDVVQLTATPGADWSFANWTGDLTGSVNPDSVTFHGNTSVTANYTQNEYTLTVTSAHGTVTKNPDQATYHEGDVVQLIATPNAGWSFANWTGDLTGSVNPGSVTIHGNTSVTANYTQNEYTLTVVSAHGTVTKLPDQATYHEGDVVQLTVTPATGWSFVNWTGGLTGTANPGSVTIHGNTSVTANYNQAPTDIALSNSSVIENQAIGTTIGTLTTTDSEVGDTHTYSFCGGANDASFSIAGDALKTAAIFDYEAKNSYAICLRTNDGHGTYDEAFTITVTDIPNVELLTPANGVSLLTNRPTFDWNDFAGAIGYNIQISKNVGFTQLVSSTNLTGATNSTYTPTIALTVNTNMWWRVRAKLTATTYSGWSEVRSFTTANPPPAPALTAPAANALITTATVLLNWNDVTMPVGTVFQKYEVQIATDAAFTIGVSLADAPISEFTTPALTPNTKYYWRVRAYNSLGQYSNWSVARYFRAALSAPNSLTPGTTVLPEEQLLTRRPTFTWNVVPGATNYTVEVSTANTFATKAINATATTNSYTHTLDLAANTSYFWRVKANGANGPSLYSQVRMFRTANPPSVPVLAAPANNALMTTTTPLLNWNNSTVPAGTTFRWYEVQMDTSNTFGNAVSALTTEFDLNNSQVNTPALPNATTYYWRVRSWNTAGDFSAWTTARSFRTPFAAPTLTLPLDAATGVALKPTFTWNAIIGATNYTLQVSRNNTFTLLVINKTVAVPTYTHTLNLAANTYYWRVRANGPYGPGAWSVYFTFTTP